MLSTVINQTEPYKVHGNDKIKAKHRLNFKKSSKLYKPLNKNEYKLKTAIEILRNIMFKKGIILTFWRILEEFCHG